MDNAPQIGVNRWHQRFSQQAIWTAPVRQHLLQILNLESAEKILEVGCGTGAVSMEIHRAITGNVYGLDIEPLFLKKAHSFDSGVRYVCGDAYRLPIPTHSMDACFCHFLLLWLQKPHDALLEMCRVTRKNGPVILFAEPDYSARIDYPVDLARIGILQSESLKKQGANPQIGRTLAHLLVDVGCRNVHSGLLGGEWGAYPTSEQTASEWELIRADLDGMLSAEEINRLEQIDQLAWQKAYRILFVPTFYAYGIL